MIKSTKFILWIYKINLIKIGAGGFDDPFLLIRIINLDELFYFIDKFSLIFLFPKPMIDASTTKTIYRLGSRFNAKYPFDEVPWTLSS